MTVLGWPTARVRSALALALALVAAAPARAEETAPPTAPTAPPAAPAAPADIVEPRPELSFLNESVIERADGRVAFFYRTNFITPSDLVAALKSSGFSALLSAGDTKTKAADPLRVVDRQNAVILEGDPDSVNLVLEAIAYFDVAAPQVFVEAKIVEVTHDSNFEVGLDYVWDRTDVGPETLFRGAGAILNPPASLQSAYPPRFPFQGTDLLFGFVGKDRERYGALDVRLQAMQMSGKAEVLSRPSIIATQGILAEVTTSEDRPVVTLASAIPNHQTFTSTSAKSGINLRVTPKHIGEAYVTLEIEPVVNGLAGLATNTPGGTFAPITTLRRAKTTVTLGDKETLVIGGLYTNSGTMEKARTPFLSDLPLLGEIFTRTRETKVKTELIFILTPTIVRKTSELKVVVPPAELERLDRVQGEPAKAKCGCPPSPPPQLPPPPGWGARFLDE